jgi:hypothetical protein
MPVAAHRSEAPTAIRTDLGAIFVSLELSQSKWLVTSLSPGGGEKMSKHAVAAGDVAGMLGRFAELKNKARMRTGRCFPIVVVQEAGLDGFWIHRVLEAEGIESHVVDPASIATSRRRRRAKTDRIDGEALVRALLLPDLAARFPEAGKPATDDLHPADDGLYFCGFNAATTGLLRQIGIEAEKIATSIERRHQS